MGVALFCKLFGHQFTAWKYIAPDSCTQHLICARCNGIGDARTLHEWSSLKAENEEFHSRTCQRCAQQERQAHSFVAGAPCPVCEGAGHTAITGVSGFDPLSPTAECGNCGGRGLLSSPNSFTCLSCGWVTPPTPSKGSGDTGTVRL